jgi:hypothetical protein
MSRFRLKHPVVVGVVVLGIAAALMAGFPVFETLVAGFATYVILRLGVAMLSGLAQPIPEPPPVGELRKVKMAYRCDICGTEVRMTVSPTEEPDPPKHCLEEMRLVTPVE